MKVIAVSRSYGSGGSELARQLADMLGFGYADGTSIKSLEEDVERCSPLLASIEDEVGPGFLKRLTGLMDNRSFYKTALCLCLYELALKSDIVIVGAGSHLAFAHYPSLFSLQVVRRLSERVKVVAHDRKLKFDDALKLIEDKDKAKSRFTKNYFDKELFDPLMFHVVVNMSAIPTDRAIQVVTQFSAATFDAADPGQSRAWLKNRLLEKKAEMVLFHLGLTQGPKVEFEADSGHLTARGVLGGKHEKEQLLEALHKLSEVTSLTDELKVEVLSRMMY